MHAPRGWSGPRRRWCARVPESRESFPVSFIPVRCARAIIDDFGERLRVEARAADQGAVDVRFGIRAVALSGLTLPP